MSGSDGISRLRKAVDNQASLGEATFMLPIGEVLAMLDEIEDELARLAWAKDVPAPRDADGEVVPLDTEVLYHDDGAECKVDYWEYRPRAKDSWVAVSNVAGVRRINNPKVLHLATTDSWEKLEKDMMDSTCGYFGRPDSCCDGCPAKNSGGCHDAYVSDVIRRAKALAGGERR